MALPKYNMEALIDMIKSKDHRKASHAFSQLFNELHGPLIYYTYNLTKDLQESEDIVSVSFNKLWLLKDNFESVYSMRAFLYVTSRNSAYDHNRYTSNTKRNIEVSVDDIEQHADRMADEDQQLEMMRSLIVSELYKEIDKLSPRLRSITKLIIIEEQTTRQVAQTLNISEQTVRNSLTKVRNLLRTRLLIKKLFLLVALLTRFYSF